MKLSLKTRRIIMFGFIAVFLIIAPILLLYASGYRLDYKRKTIIQTGTLFLEAKGIKKADIFINDILYEQPLNEKLFIYNLLPGEYKIKISKEGFYDWEKKLQIQSSLTTFAIDIVLFEKNDPILLLDKPINNFQISPDYKKFIFQINNQGTEELYLYDLNLQEEKLIYRNSTRENLIKKISWAPSAKKILIKKQDNQNIIINVDSQDLEIINLNKRFVGDFSNMKWDDFSDDTLYGFFDNTIYKFSLSLNKKEILFSGNDLKISENFLVDNSNLFYFKINETNQELIRTNLFLKSNQSLFQSSLNNNYSFIESPEDYLTLIDKEKQKLVVITKNPLPQEITLTLETIKEFSAKNAVWEFEDENKLIFTNDFEISIYYPEDNKTYLVNRYGTSIQKVSWYPNLNYLFLSFENNIKIIDIYSENGTRNITNIAELNKINDFSLDKKGESLYFSGESTDESGGLWQLILKK